MVPLAEQPFLVWTDHCDLEYLQTAKHLNSRQSWWALFFNRFNFHLCYRAGAKNTKPDALSQMPSDPGDILPRACVLGAIRWEGEECFLQGQDMGVAPDGCPPNRLFVLADLKSAIIQWDHASPLSCYPRALRALSCVRQHLWWPSMVSDVRELVAACLTCARNKGSNRPASGLLHLLPTPH